MNNRHIFVSCAFELAAHAGWLLGRFASVEGACGPAFLIDRPVAKHLEVLGRVPFFGIRVVDE